jgi:hypothetical protein
MQTTPTLGPQAPAPAGPDSLEQRRKLAIEQIKRKNQFLVDVVVYLVINALMVGIWASTGAGYFWPIWVILGWGAAVVIHGYIVYRGNAISNEQIEREMQRLPSEATELPDDWGSLRSRRRARRQDRGDV